MEQARYWMWKKRKQPPINNLSSDESTWEEQAFAEDTAGGLGGCWPPRSYSCIFCRRDFGSAQALGGHMNVHRRDRAGLKQSPSSDHTEKMEINLQNYNFRTLSDLSLGLIECPNPSSDHHASALPSPASPSRVSTPEENSSEKTAPLLSSSTIIAEESKKGASNPRSLRGTWALNLGAQKKKKNPSRDIVDDDKSNVDHMKTDLSMSLNLVTRRARPSTGSANEDEDEEERNKGSKRRRTNPVLHFFRRSSNSIDDLDLELRLGVERV